MPFPNVNFGKPVVITKGGEYRGDWESKNTSTPVVEIKTDQPVTLHSGTMAGAGYLVKSWGYTPDIRLINMKGYGLVPTSYSENYRISRRFLTLDTFRNVLVEGCEMYTTAGILIAGKYGGSNSAGQSVRILRNKVRNINGLTTKGKELVQFVQFNVRGAMRYVEVAWNEVINEPEKSAVEDNINVYNTRGWQSSPIHIHDNYIQGAYPHSTDTRPFSGCGIITDSPGTGKDGCTAYMLAENNQLVNLGNSSLGVGAGNNILYRNNRVVNSGIMPNGKRHQNVTSLWANDYYGKGASFANHFEGNYVHAAQTVADDFSVLKHATEKNNTFIRTKPTRADEAAEYRLWLKKLKDQNVTIGTGVK